MKNNFWDKFNFFMGKLAFVIFWMATFAIIWKIIQLQLFYGPYLITTEIHYSPIEMMKMFMSKFPGYVKYLLILQIASFTVWLITLIFKKV